MLIGRLELRINWPVFVIFIRHRHIAGAAIVRNCKVQFLLKCGLIVRNFAIVVRSTNAFAQASKIDSKRSLKNKNPKNVINLNTYFLPLASYCTKYLDGRLITEYFAVESSHVLSLNLEKTLSEMMTAAIEVPSDTDRLRLSILHTYRDLMPFLACLLYTSPSPRDKRQTRMPSSA